MQGSSSSNITTDDKRKALKAHIRQRAQEIEPSWFRNDTGYYCWDRNKWIDILCRGVDLMPADTLPHPDSILSTCWMAPSARYQISAGSSSEKPLLYNCSYVFWHPESRDEIRARPTAGDTRRRQSDARHISHRCGNDNCWSPYCVVLETPAENEDRKGCRYGALELCPHRPKCRFARPCSVTVTQKN